MRFSVYSFASVLVVSAIVAEAQSQTPPCPNINGPTQHSQGKNVDAPLLRPLLPTFGKPVRSVEGLNTLKGVLQSLGGESLDLGSVSTLRSEGSVTSSNATESNPAPVEWLYKLHEAVPRFRKRAKDSTGEHEMLANANGTSMYLRQEKRNLGKYLSYAQPALHAPVFLIWDALVDPQYEVVAAGKQMCDGLVFTHVQITNKTSLDAAEVSTEDWYIDSQTSLPRWVTIRQPDIFHPHLLRNQTMIYGAYQAFAGGKGLLFPITVTSSTQLRESITTWKSFDLNVDLSKYGFDSEGIQ